MSPVTLFAVYAVTFMFTFRSTLSSSKLTGFVSNVSICPFSTFTVTFSVLPCKPSSAPTSAFRYVLVLASSNSALTSSDRSPFFKMIGTVRRAMKSALELFCVIMVVCCACGCSFPTVTEAAGSAERVPRSARCSLWPASTRFGSVWSFVLLDDISTLRSRSCSNLWWISWHRFFHMFNCLGTVYHNVRRIDNDNITATVLQCSIAQWDSSVQISSISRSHVVLHKLDTAFSLYCDRSWIHQRMFFDCGVCATTVLVVGCLLCLSDRALFRTQSFETPPLVLSFS